MSITVESSDPSANPWLHLCSARLTVLDDPSIPFTEVKSKFAQELRWLEEARSVIRSRLNMLPLIARLSPEVLAHIFRHLADIDVPHAVAWPERVKEHLGWMRVTHVCRSWRIVALDYPDLWGRGDICSPWSWAEERFRRSKDAPFDVWFDCSFSPGTKPGTHIFSYVLHNAHRIRCAALDTSASWDAMDGSWHDLLSSPAASLESFTYLNSGFGRDSLPADVFDRKAPRLKSLRLQGTLLPFESPIYENLAHLRLGHLGRRDPDYRGPPPFTREQFLALLHRMPKLESLMLEYGVIPGNSPDVENFEHDEQALLPTRGPVALSSLQLLELRDTQSSCVWMATQLSIPAAASIIIRPERPYAEYEATGRAFLPLLMRHLGTWDCAVQPIQTMSFKLARQSWRFICWKELNYGDIDPCEMYKFDHIDGMSPEEDGSKPPCCNIWSSSGSYDITIDVLETIVRPVLSEAATCNIRVLDICGAESLIGCTDWLELFASFTALESFTLGDTAVASNFVQVFGLDLTLNLDTFSTAGDMPYALFPSLRVLMFRKVDFRRFVDIADARLSELMTESLTERLTINTKLEEIRLIQCEWNQHWINAVRRIGPKVLCKAPISWGSMTQSRRQRQWMR